jgi:predicted O-methyltransferase YrrM
MEHFYQNIGEDWFNYSDLYNLAISTFDHAKFVEIGSWKGRSAAYMGVEILNSNKHIDFYCVDTWLGSEEHKDFDFIKNNSLYEEFLKNTAPISEIIKPIRKSSTQAAKEFADEYFDFIFIDAAHDYESVKQDLEAWFPKLKKGGIFAGHDYHPFWGTYKAVNEWSKNYNKQVSQYGQQCWIHYNQ